jgi:hypothetical protein
MSKTDQNKINDGLLGRLKILLKKELTRIKLRRRGSFSTSSWTSLALRPLLESGWLKVSMGGPLMAAAVVGSMQFPDIEYVLTSWSVTEPIDEVYKVETYIPEKSELAYKLPTPVFYGISQKFYLGHPGLDIRSPLGSDVVSIANGVVELVEFSNLGYGRRVIVRHADGLKSMYAHFGLVEARVGQVVAAGTKLGEIGMSGWTTGPHLHLEVYKDGVAVNPLIYLHESIVAYQESLLLAEAN